MAQAAGILGFKTQGKTPADGSMYYSAGVDKLRFKRPCVPGDRVMLRATYSRSGAASGNLMSAPMWMVNWPLQPPFSVLIANAYDSQPGHSRSRRHAG